MITSKQDLRFYLEQDRIALKQNRNSMSSRIKGIFFPNEVWKFERILRYTEYYTNVKGTNPISKVYNALMKTYYRIHLHKLGVKLGYSIHCNCFGPGLSIPHYGTIVVNSKARIGANCRLHTSVNIGTSAGEKKAPIIGDNVYIGPGAIIFGDIRIANNTTIGANATVNKSIETEHCVVAGSPAKIVKENYPSWMEFNKVEIK